MSGEEFFPFRVLLVLRQFLNLQAGIVRFLNRVVSAFADADRGELVPVLAAGINSENLILLLLVET